MSSTRLGTVIVRESFKFPNSIRSCPEFNAVTFAWMMAGNMSRHRSVLLSSNLKPEQFRMTGSDFQVNSKSMAIKCLIIVLTHSSQEQQCMSTTISSVHCGSYPIIPRELAPNFRTVRRNGSKIHTLVTREWSWNPYRQRKFQLQDRLGSC